MGRRRKDQTVLQVKRAGKWKYVFCKTENRGVVTTETRAKALPGDRIETFRKRYGNSQFKVQKGSRTKRKKKKK